MKDFDKNLIIQTNVHFGKFYSKMSNSENVEILSNFINFSKLLIQLKKKKETSVKNA